VKSVSILVSVGFWSLAVQLPAAEPSSVKTKDGRVLTGEILGRLALAKTPEVTVIFGKDISRVDELGVHVKPDSVVVFGGMARGSNAEDYKSTTALDILRAVMPLAAKDKGQETDKATIFRLMLSGQGDGPGFGTTAVRGGRAYFFKSATFENPVFKEPVVGELIERGGVVTLGPTFTV
jgi:uncharacterized protein (DUF736 family)